MKNKLEDYIHIENKLSKEVCSELISNITNVVAQLGSQGLVGLVAIGVIAWIFTRKN